MKKLFFLMAVIFANITYGESFKFIVMSNNKTEIHDFNCKYGTSKTAYRPSYRDTTEIVEPNGGYSYRAYIEIEADTISEAIDRLEKIISGTNIYYKIAKQ